MTADAKMRVYELARELEVPAKELVTTIRSIGIEVAGHMSSIEVEDAARVRGAVRGKGAGDSAAAGKRRGSRRAGTKKPAAAKPAAAKPAAAKPAAGEPKKAAAKKPKKAAADKTAKPAPRKRGAGRAAPAAAKTEAAPAAEPPAPLSPEEQELVELYGDELAATAPTTVETEYTDEQTADEDRPMMPEIVAPRRDRYGRTRERRGGRREERERRRAERDQRRERKPEGAPAAPRPPAPRALPAAAAAPPAPAPDDLAALVYYRPGNALGDGAQQTLTELRAGQPVQVKQLAQMMRKRKVLDGDPETLWPHLKAALLADAQSYRDHGLRPRVVYRGRDLFALPDAKLGDELRVAEAQLCAAADAVRAATHRALRDRLSRLSPEQLERVAHVYLLRSGWTGIEWIKRVERSSYAVAESPDGARGLVAVRAGADPVDRRGVGELRAGVEAKGLTAGLLLSAMPLSDAARAELERPGRSVAVICGDALVAALIRAGVGVTSAVTPVHIFDLEFFDEVAGA